MTKRPGRLRTPAVPPSRSHGLAPSRSQHPARTTTHTLPDADASSPSGPSRRGRPRLTAEHLRERLIDYCGRYGVALNDEGLPPFPAGQRETAQHREWMSLYKARRRLSDRGPGTADLERRQALLAAQRGRCAVCRKTLDLEDARLDGHETHPAVLHARCLEIVALARALGPEALDRVRTRL
jgi:hypothetical protein